VLSAGNYCSGKLHDKSDLLTYGDDDGWVSLGDYCTDSAFTSRVKYNLKVTGIIAAALPDHADNAAALTAGLVVNDLYRTSGDVKIVT
jgi:hypothetical protein